MEDRKKENVTSYNVGFKKGYKIFMSEGQNVYL